MEKLDLLGLSFYIGDVDYIHKILTSLQGKNLPMANIKIVELNHADSEKLSELTDKESTMTVGGVEFGPYGQAIFGVLGQFASAAIERLGKDIFR